MSKFFFVAVLVGGLSPAMGQLPAPPKPESPMIIQAQALSQTIRGGADLAIRPFAMPKPAQQVQQAPVVPAYTPPVEMPRNLWPLERSPRQGLWGRVMKLFVK
jgi:hypothetical protein